MTWYRHVGHRSTLFDSGACLVLSDGLQCIFSEFFSDKYCGPVVPFYLGHSGSFCVSFCVTFLESVTFVFCHVPYPPTRLKNYFRHLWTTFVFYPIPYPPTRLKNSFRQHLWSFWVGFSAIILVSGCRHFEYSQ